MYSTNNTSRTRTILGLPKRGLQVALAAAALHLAAQPGLHASGGLPDLEAVRIAGPDKVAPGGRPFLLTYIKNVGGGTVGRYDVELRLSIDETITSSDILVGTFSTSQLGYRNLHGLIPAFTPHGRYYWGLIVSPIAGEFNVSNNRVAGNAVEVCAPDLRSVSISGPIAGFSGHYVQLSKNIMNMGAPPFEGEWDYQIRLSTNRTITLMDTLVGSFTGRNQGPEELSARIPSSLAEGTYYWGLIVRPVQHELNTANNSVVGNQIEVKAQVPAGANLALDSTDPIYAHVPVGGHVPLPSFRTVRNCGTFGTLTWNVSGAEPSWLEVSPNAGVLARGEETQVMISFAPHGLADGDYWTFLTFRNVNNASDYEFVEVHLRVGQPSFQPGDKIKGKVRSHIETRTLSFMGNADTRLKLKAKKLAPNLSLLITLRGPDGSVYCYVLSRKDPRAKLPLSSTGEYTLEIRSRKGTGKYVLKTKAKQTTGKSMLSDDRGQSQSFQFAAAAGAVLHADAVGTRRFRGKELKLKLLDEHDRLVHEMASPGCGAAEITELRIPQDGVYRLVVDGIVGKKAVRLQYEIEPARADAEIELP